MRIKKKKSLFIKLGILVSAFIGVLCSLVVPTHAYTLSDNFVYSSNGLNLLDPDTCPLAISIVSKVQSLELAIVVV